MTITSIAWVLSTIGKVDLHPVLESLARQTTPARVVVVDQSDGTEVAAAVADFADQLSIVHTRSNRRGAARGRNDGIAACAETVVCFADDDAIYPPNYAEDVRARIGCGYDFICARVVDPAQYGARSRLPQSCAVECDISARNLLATTMEPALVVTRRLCDAVRFDERLGVGSGTPAGADEGADFLMRAMAHGFRGRYIPSVLVYHPDKVATATPDVIRRAYKYAVGRGYVLRHYWFGGRNLARELARPLAGAAWYGMRFDGPRAKYYMYVWVGKVRGLFLRLPGGPTR